MPGTTEPASARPAAARSRSTRAALLGARVLLATAGVLVSGAAYADDVATAPPPAAAGATPADGGATGHAAEPQAALHGALTDYGQYFVVAVLGLLAGGVLRIAVSQRRKQGPPRTE